MESTRYTPSIQTTSAAAFTRAALGPASALDRYQLELPARKRTLRGKVFLRGLLQLTGMEVSVTRLGPGEGLPFLHRHRTHEELYLVTGGRGEMQVDGETFALEEGSVVRVAPAGARAIRAAAGSELHFVCIQAVQDSMPAGIEAGADGLPVEGPVTWPG